MSKPRTALLIAAAVALAFAGGWVARSMRSAQSAASPASRSVPAMESAQLEGVSGELREILTQWLADGMPGLEITKDVEH